MTRTVLLITIATLLVAGCVKLKNEPLNRKNYVFEVARQAAPREDSGKMIRLLRLGIAPAYGGKELVYRLPGGQVQADYYNEYFSSPELLLSQELTRWLRDSGVATLVMADSVALTDAALEAPSPNSTAISPATRHRQYWRCSSSSFQSAAIRRCFTIEPSAKPSP
ncbi:hypothetical protein [Salidesulfovibrio brasiliensis]|uniref:hypothetical protein n=1 Tax=Salidesulfovibrio brasiliensis TaxID=221711 RepID=UPI0006D00F45|nr:hypothetical protein [Salidesulfovibrio brasiliensis]